MYGIRQCNRKKNSGEIGAFFTEIVFLNFSCDIELKIGNITPLHKKGSKIKCRKLSPDTAYSSGDRPNQ